VTRLPLASGSAGAVTMVWLLHLLDRAGSAAALASAGRVLRPGGVLVTTVGKNDALYQDADDASAILRPARDRFGRRGQSDEEDWVLQAGGRCGLSLAGRASFPGLGQGRSPRQWRSRLLGGEFSWAEAAHAGSLAAALAALPGQDRARPDPVYQLVALRKSG